MNLGYTQPLRLQGSVVIPWHLPVIFGYADGCMPAAVHDCVCVHDKQAHDHTTEGRVTTAGKQRDSRGSCRIQALSIPVLVLFTLHNGSWGLEDMSKCGSRHTGTPLLRGSSTACSCSSTAVHRSTSLIHVHVAAQRYAASPLLISTATAHTCTCPFLYITVRAYQSLLSPMVNKIVHAPSV